MENPYIDQREFTQKVFNDYAYFEEELIKVFRDRDKKVYIQDQLARFHQGKSTSAYTTLFWQDAIWARINEDRLISLFYNGLKADIKDELYKEDYPDTLDKYIAKAIYINNCLYTQRQQKKGQQKLIVGSNQANEGKKQYDSIAYSTRPGPIEIDVIQT